MERYKRSRRWIVEWRIKPGGKLHSKIVRSYSRIGAISNADIPATVPYKLITAVSLG